MGDEADKSLTLEIKTKADFAQAEALESRLKRDILQAKLLGKEFAEQEAQLKRVQAAMSAYSKRVADAEEELNNLSPATRKYIEQLQEQTRKEGESAASKGEVRRGLREIGRELPIVGEIGRMVMEPLIGAFVLLSSVVSATLEAIKQMGNRSTPEFARMTEAIEKQKDAMEEVEIAANSYDRALVRLATTSESASESAKAFMERFKSRSDAEASLNEASQKKQTAILEAAEKMGFITHQQFIARKLALDEEYAKKRVDLENKVAETQLEEKYRERTNTEIQAASLEQSLALKRAAAKKGAGGAALTGGNLENDKKNLEATEEKIKQLEEEYNELKAKTTGLGAFSTVTPQIVLEAQKTQNEAQQKAERDTADLLRKRIAQDREKNFTATDTSKSAAEELQATEERLRQAMERLRELNLELPITAETTRNQVATRNAVANSESQTRTVGSLPELPAALANAQALKNQTPEQLSALISILESSRQSQWQMLATIKAHNGNQAQIATAIAETNRELGVVRKQLESLTKSIKNP